jgi:hypothetical protein
MLKTHVLLINALFAVSTTAHAQYGDEAFFRFFGNRDIDYWQTGKTVHDPLGGSVDAGNIAVAPTPTATPEPKIFSGSTVVREGDTKPFSWDRYRDPRAPEFWDDGGDWIPPRPFREAAANPTSENVGEYLAWQGRKTAVVAKFQNVLSEKALPFSDWKKLSVAYFYQSKCPHCIASMAIVEEVKMRGAKFTFVQLDYAENAPLHKPSIPYTAQWKKSFPVEATPTWILKLGERTTTLTGSVSLEELAASAAGLQQQRRQ